MMNNADTLRRLKERDEKLVETVKAGRELDLRDVNALCQSARHAAQVIKRQDDTIALLVKYARNIAEQDCDCDGDTFLCPVCGLRDVLFDVTGDEVFRRG